MAVEQLRSRRVPAPAVDLVVGVVGAAGIAAVVGRRDTAAVAAVAAALCVLAATGLPRRSALQHAAVAGGGVLGLVLLGALVDGRPVVAGLAAFLVALVAAVVPAVPGRAPRLVALLAAAATLPLLVGNGREPTGEALLAASLGVGWALGWTLARHGRDPDAPVRAALADALLPEASAADLVAAAEVVRGAGSRASHREVLEATVHWQHARAAIRRLLDDAGQVSATDARRLAAALTEADHAALRLARRVRQREATAEDHAVPPPSADDGELGSQARAALLRVAQVLAGTAPAGPTRAGVPPSSSPGLPGNPSSGTRPGGRLQVGLDALRGGAGWPSTLLLYGVRRGLLVGALTWQLQSDQTAAAAVVAVSAYAAVPVAGPARPDLLLRRLGLVVAAVTACLATLALLPATPAALVVGAALLAALVWRGGAVDAVAAGAAVLAALWLLAEPDPAPLWIGLRVLDVAVGAVLALVVTWVTLLPAERPRPRERVAEVGRSAQTLLDTLATAARPGGLDAAAVRRDWARFARTVGEASAQQEAVDPDGDVAPESFAAATATARDVQSAMAGLLVAMADDAGGSRVPALAELVEAGAGSLAEDAARL